MVNRMNEERNPANQKPVKIPRPSLNNALTIEPKLRECKKFNLTDREFFSRNLGALVCDAMKRDQNLSINKIFQRAFGSASESMYKKRKSLISLPNESINPKNIRSKARDFLDLISALSQIKSQNSAQSEENIRKHLILCFVEGSSFDEQRNIKDRMYAESLAHVKGVLSKIVAKTLNEVDLDYQYAWYQNYYKSGTPSLDYMHNFTAPSINLADVFKQKEVSERAYITLDKEDIERAKNKYDGMGCLIRRHLFENYSEIPYEKEYEGTYFLDQFPWEYKTVDEIFPKLEWVQKKVCYFKRSSIYLEIRFDDWSGRWLAVPVWKVDDCDAAKIEDLADNSIVADDDDDWDTYYEYHKGRHENFEKTIPVFSVDNFIFNAAEYDDLESGKKVYILFWSETDSGWEVDFRGVTCSHYDFNDTPVFSDLSLAERDEFFMSQPDFENEYERINVSTNIDAKDSRERNSYTMAPKDSFADLMLRNLAYSPKEKRLDNLVLEDARKKNKIFKHFEEKCRKKYLDSLKKLEEG